MDWIEGGLQRLAARLSQMLDPPAAGLERFGLLIRRYLGEVGVPYDWHGTVIILLWILVLGMVLRTLTSWLRLFVAVAAALLLAKVYGVLPGP